MAETAINLAEKLALVKQYWSPRTIADLNDHEVKVVRVLGEFTWHAHDGTDELFLVVDGRLTIRFRDHEVVLRPGELCVVDRGVEHCPVAEVETHILLIEPRGVINTGATGGELTAAAHRV
jgi:mannose-6-phosphate isomerase-like protein (cupin superfamily)